MTRTTGSPIAVASAKSRSSWPGIPAERAGAAVGVDVAEVQALGGGAGELDQVVERAAGVRRGDVEAGRRAVRPGPSPAGLGGAEVVAGRSWGGGHRGAVAGRG